ncbi:DUF2938 domain-containing protein [Salipiger mucosus]|uniref:DUF2938 domain-containing protein n=1 Tax=Salipiger mucosus DSM 16094 TaxID=1123237 RepID=S9SKN2_9RHOB|nr:DUF2938 family protein [Salipiger mucosus]EPX86939.1 hypothetical protein Salmuc_01591 [Salipiger mucosus DSM 16094]
MDGWIWAGLAMGIGGTVAMDLWALALNRLAGQGMPNWANVGRWVVEVMRGRVFHDDIGAVSPVQGELALGWAFHYAVGAIYGALFLAIVGPGWLEGAAFVPLWIFSLLTIAAGWFLLQPGMGLGWAAARTPQPWKARGMGLLAHTAFAVGMWVVALAVAV